MEVKKQHRLIKIIQDEDDGYLVLAALIEGRYGELDAWIRERQSRIVGKPTEREGRNEFNLQDM